MSKTSQPEKNKFVGTWATDDDDASTSFGKRVVFSSDATVTLPVGFTGTYEITEGNYLRVQLSIDGNQVQYLFDYDFSNNGNTLILANLNLGRLSIYTKE